jgi:hypothetical protein
VLDKNTLAPLEMVNVYLGNNGAGTVTNKNGVFEIKFRATKNTEKLHFSHIGYITASFTTEELSKKDSVLILLDSDAKILSEIVIRGGKEEPIEKIMANVLAKMPENFPSKYYSYTAFYREYLTDSDTCRRLTEAAVEVCDAVGYQDNRQDTQSMFMRIEELKISYDFSKFKNINGILDKSYPEKHNILRSRLLLFDPERMLAMTFNVVKQVTQDEQLLHEISFTGRNVGFAKIVNGTIWVNAENYAVERISFKYIPVFQPVAHINKGEKYGFAVYPELEENIIFKNIEGKYYVAYQSKRCREMYVEKIEDYDEVVSETFTEMLTTKIETQNPNKFPDSSIYDIQKMTFNPAFWQNYTTPADTPEDKKRKEDLLRINAITTEMIR